jgi:hypothetical protein
MTEPSAPVNIIGSNMAFSGNIMACLVVFSLFLDQIYGITAVIRKGYPRTQGR